MEARPHSKSTESGSLRVGPYTDILLNGPENHKVQPTLRTSALQHSILLNGNHPTPTRHKYVHKMIWDYPLRGTLFSWMYHYSAVSILFMPDWQQIVFSWIVSRPHSTLLFTTQNRHNASRGGSIALGMFSFFSPNLQSPWMTIK